MRLVVATWVAAAPLYALLVSAQTAADAPARLIDIDECRPAYPAESLAANEEGKTLLRAHITAAGELRGLSVLRSSGHPRLDQATLKALEHCRFAPGTRSGVPIDSSMVLEYRWRIDQEPAPPADSQPRLLNLRECHPAYPPESLEREETGTTTLRLHIGEGGNVLGTSLVRSSGSERLDRAAMDALSRCRYAPARREGTPVAASVNVEYVWRLDPPLNRLTCRPEYPIESIRAEEQGTTTVRFRIGADGKAQDVQVAKSSGHRRLDAASIEALKRCSFRVDNTTPPDQATVEFTWRLQDVDSAAPAVQVGPMNPDPHVPKL